MTYFAESHQICGIVDVAQLCDLIYGSSGSGYVGVMLAERCERFLEADVSCALFDCIANIYFPVHPSLRFSHGLGRRQKTGKDDGIIMGVDETSSA
jgi:hypothetical protein